LKLLILVFYSKEEKVSDLQATVMQTMLVIKLKEKTEVEAITLLVAT